MEELIASISQNLEQTVLFLDGSIIMDGSSKGGKPWPAKVKLERGKEYFIYWFVKGVAGVTYSIGISSPRSAELHVTSVLGASGKDHGVFRFKA